MDDHLVIAHVRRVVVPLDMREIEFASDVLREPSRDFHSTDVFADGMMRAGFRHQNLIAGLEIVDRQRAAHELAQVPLEARE